MVTLPFALLVLCAARVLAFILLSHHHLPIVCHLPKGKVVRSEMDFSCFRGDLHPGTQHSALNIVGAQYCKGEVWLVDY